MNPNVEHAIDSAQLSIHSRRIGAVLELLPICREWFRSNSIDELLEFLVTDYVHHSNRFKTMEYELYALEQFIGEHRIAESMPVVRTVLKSEIESILRGDETKPLPV